MLPTQTVFTIALAVAFLGERPGRAQLAGAAVAVGGVVLIAAGRAHGVPLGGLLLCIGAAASWGVGNICNRRAQAPDALALLVWSSLVPPLPLFALSLAFEGSHQIGTAFADLGPGGLLALLYVVVVSTGFGFGTWTWLLRRHPASRVAPASLLVPPVGIAAAWIALGESPSTGELAGAAIILAGLALATLAVRLPRRSARTASAGSGAGVRRAPSTRPASSARVWFDQRMATEEPIAPERPVGEDVDWRPANRPERTELRGAHVLLRPLDADRDAEALYAQSHPPLADPGLWTYLPNGPYRDPAELQDALRVAAASDDPLFFTLVTAARGPARRRRLVSADHPRPRRDRDRAHLVRRVAAPDDRRPPRRSTCSPRMRSTTSDIAGSSGSATR